MSKEPNLDRLVKVFMQISEGIAARWIQMPKGMLLLVMVPENLPPAPFTSMTAWGNSSLWVSFEGADDTLTVEEFESLLGEYRLMDYAANPALFQSPVEPPAIA